MLALKRANKNDTFNAIEIEGEILIDDVVINTLNSQLKDINKGKIGAPYQYPDLIIKTLYLLRAYYGISYRGLETIIMEISKYIGGLKNPDHSTIHKRLKQLSAENKKLSLYKDKNLTIIVDSNSANILRSKDWRIRLWKVKKVYRRVFFKIDIKKHIIFIELS